MKENTYAGFACSCSRDFPVDCRFDARRMQHSNDACPGGRQGDGCGVCSRGCSSGFAYDHHPTRQRRASWHLYCQTGGYPHSDWPRHGPKLERYCALESDRKYQSDRSRPSASGNAPRCRKCCASQSGGGHAPCRSTFSRPGGCRSTRAVAAAFGIGIGIGIGIGSTCCSYCFCSACGGGRSRR